MTLLPRGLKVHLALGYTDMRKGIDGLAMLVQAVLRQDPFSGRLFTKRLEQGVFLWPPDVDPGETLALSSEQLSMLIDGVDWRAPERRWRPAVAG
jgi:transposase